MKTVFSFNLADFFKIESWHTELEPLEYWIEDGGMGYEGSSYIDCVNWIKENYLNSYKIQLNIV